VSWCPIFTARTLHLLHEEDAQVGVNSSQFLLIGWVGKVLIDQGFLQTTHQAIGCSFEKRV
jgi:hypothetical protein